MAIRLSFDQALFRWQAKHGQKMTYAELAQRAHISESTFYRLTSGQPTKLDLNKLNRICKVLECQPGDLLERVATNAVSDPNAMEWQQEWNVQDMKAIQEAMGKPDDETAS